MIFKGISKDFSLFGEEQYNTIGEFWDEMTKKYGLENLLGLGYDWKGGKISYSIGLKEGEIDGCNSGVSIPDDGWETVVGKTENLKEIYDKIYTGGSLDYEIESFYEDGTCEIKYHRK